MDRNDLQRMASLLLEKEKRLVCQWATSCGKSGVALKFLMDNPGLDTLILVPEQVNIDNWKAEFLKFGIPLDNIEIACYASLHKYEDTHWSFLVLDEVPHIDTDKRMSLLRTIEAGYVLALGAVIDETELFSLQSLYGSFKVSTISLEKAIEMGIVPDPKVYVMHCQLNDTRRNLWHNGRAVTAKEMYQLIKREVDDAVTSYEKSSNAFTKRKMLLAGSKRKRFLGSQKDNVVESLCGQLRNEGKRFICFCSSIQQAELLGGDNSFTSKSDRSARHLERFNSHEIDSLFVVGKCIEGQNLKDIDCGIITQLGGTHRITVQEVGRVLRSKEPVIYVPIFDRTKDDSFLRTLTSNISPENIIHKTFQSTL